MSQIVLPARWSGDYIAIMKNNGRTELWTTNAAFYRAI